MKENIIQYKPTNKEIKIEDCFDNIKTSKLIEKINKSNVTEKEKQFLVLSAQRHIIFNYKNIAEYYCNATKEMQELMEESALVIIDIKDAISNGFVKLYDKLEDIEGNKNEK